MRSRLVVAFCLAFVVMLLPLGVAAQTQTVRQVQLTRSGPLPANPSISAYAQQGPELDSALAGDDNDGSDGSGPGISVNRGIAKGPGAGMRHSGSGKAKSNPELNLTVDGINHFAQRFVAAGGNQFSIEPPDQGLCVGNGFVLETVNDTLQIFDTAGNPVSAPTGLNSFYGYAPAIDRTKSPLQFGPSITDPSCIFDGATQRWFHVVLTLDRAVNTSQALNGNNHLDVAVSVTADPTGAWNVYSLPVQDDGTQGTPDHHCVQRQGKILVHGPCLGDYPHIGADANGFYITTNEFSLAGPGFFGSQIYAFSKRQLAAGVPFVNVVQFDTSDPSLGVQLDGTPGFTVWPATSTGNTFEGSQGGTEYFLSSEAVFQDSGVDSRLRLWAVSNTSSIDTAPALNIGVSVVNTIPYAVPGRANQKAGDVPQAECLSDSTLQVTPTLSGCWRFCSAPAGHSQHRKTGGQQRFANAASGAGERKTMGRAGHGTNHQRRHCAASRDRIFRNQSAFGQRGPRGLRGNFGQQPDISRDCRDAKRKRCDGLHRVGQRSLSERRLRGHRFHHRRGRYSHRRGRRGTR